MQQIMNIQCSELRMYYAANYECTVQRIGNYKFRAERGVPVQLNYECTNLVQSEF